MVSDVELRYGSRKLTGKGTGKGKAVAVKAVAVDSRRLTP
jgi:hypothetical protein